MIASIESPKSQRMVRKVRFQQTEANRFSTDLDSFKKSADGSKKMKKEPLKVNGPVK